MKKPLELYKTYYYAVVMVLCNQFTRVSNKLIEFN